MDGSWRVSTCRGWSTTKIAAGVTGLQSRGLFSITSRKVDILDKYDWKPAGAQITRMFQNARCDNEGIQGGGFQLSIPIASLNQSAWLSEYNSMQLAVVVSLTFPGENAERLRWIWIPQGLCVSLSGGATVDC